MKNIRKVFFDNHYAMTNETPKAMEFEHRENGDFIYILPNKQLTIVLHPEKVEADEELYNKASKETHSTALREFPKRAHTGKQPIQYGYAFVFQSNEECSQFLKELEMTSMTQ
ncbi:hypothetical protein [Halobacillus litoralis]|uniref:hypothetical protein n=1 Tax=Halobacillus litoralis TaxID=45668 RepID=UPI001CFCFDF4|nr:hypothetical protein [Halobacillus litoralis]